jgi:SAM-dependent methyltransferase
MSLPDKWPAVIAEGRTVRAVEEGIYSVLSDGPHHHLYDRRAAAYDLVVGTRFYNRVMWGARLPDYVEFAQQAVASNHGGLMLDAGCGSLLFTARVYLYSERPILAFDQSLQMLRRAKARLIRLAGHLPERILLLQADLNDMPFKPRSFQTTLCMNVLHHVAGAADFISCLKESLVGGGHLYLTSLVMGNRLIGDYYLKTLYRRGDFVRPRSGMDLRNMLEDSFGSGLSYRIQGNMAYATAVNAI